MNKETTEAFEFLKEKNVLAEYMNKEKYVNMLVDFVHYQSGEALQKLAGFYLYAVANIYPATKQEFMIRSTFAHDLGQAKVGFMLPRSDNYLEYWENREL